jgi:hypothetical protein
MDSYPTAQLNTWFIIDSKGPRNWIPMNCGLFLVSLSYYSGFEGKRVSFNFNMQIFNLLYATEPVHFVS